MCPSPIRCLLPNRSISPPLPSPAHLSPILPIRRRHTIAAAYPRRAVHPLLLLRRGAVLRGNLSLVWSGLSPFALTPTPPPPPSSKLAWPPSTVRAAAGAGARREGGERPGEVEPPSVAGRRHLLFDHTAGAPDRCPCVRAPPGRRQPKIRPFSPVPPSICPSRLSIHGFIGVWKYKYAMANLFPLLLLLSCPISRVLRLKLGCSCHVYQ
ncbi:hypothetical protein VPH35_078292 [Triticum aestivum]